MIAKIPKIEKYLVVQERYGGEGQLAYVAAGDDTPVIFGSVSLPEESYPGFREGKGEEKKAKARAELNKKFSAMVVEHLNAGLRSAGGAARMNRREALGS